MNYRDCVERLKLYFRARIPFISIHTVERARALEALREASESEELKELPFLVHTLSKGLTELRSDKTVSEASDVAHTLGFISQRVRNEANTNQTFVFTEVSNIGTDSDTARFFLDVITLAIDTGGVIVVLTQDTVWSQLQRTGMNISLDLPEEEEVLQIIKNLIVEHVKEKKVHNEWDDDDFREASMILSGITKVEIENVIVSLIAKKEIKKSDLDELKFVKDKLFSNINGLEKIDVSDSILETGGLDGLKKWLDDKNKLQTPSKRDELKSRGLQPPRGILLVGVPGCGKSLSAKAIAASWKLPLFRLDFATVQGMYVGQSEQQLREAFQAAEHVSPCVLWIDEIEKGLAAGSDSSGVTTRLVGQFLFWMQECKKPVFVVATANNVDKLPPELLRRGRFDELFFLDLPNETERAEILSLYMKKYLPTEISDEIKKKCVAKTDGFTGAELESSIRDIAYMKIANNDLDLNEELILEVLENLVPLSEMSPDTIEQIREWGLQKAVPASGRPIEVPSPSATRRCRKVYSV